MSVGKWMLIGAIVYGIANPQVLSDYTERLYVHSVSAPYRPAASQMIDLNRRAARIEGEFEAGRGSKSQIRHRLLNTYHELDRLLYKVSQLEGEETDRDELMQRIREAQSGIDSWGVANGF